MKSIIFMAIVITALCCVTTQAAVVFFDDFESGALDTAKWTNESAGGSYRQGARRFNKEGVWHNASKMARQGEKTACRASRQESDGCSKP